MSSSSRAAVRGRRRVAYLVSTAGAALAATAPVAAQDRAPPLAIASAPEPYSATVDLGAGGSNHSDVASDAGAASSFSNSRFAVPPSAPEPEIVISNPGTPTTARDAANVTGIGQMIVDNGGGSVGLCTGTLINPRTVIFAAHCVNSRAATAYGPGGTAIGFGFEAYLRNEAAGRPDELGQWLFAGPNQFRTNVASSFYNVSQVRYNPLSLEPAAQGFLYGDVATATFDTPAANVPTWALLFSILPQVPITAEGTGYNVQIAGYGNNGSASTGSTGGIDFRRRLAENMIGALTDLKTFETYIFGSSTSPTANLYFMDFDDPRRRLSGASQFDFNAFRDNARGVGTAFPSEGITAAGDSGGPLILQTTFTRQIVAGVLSGGYTRFFNGQPANGYGTVSFYQPLYLYWDWIAGNNPYRYVSANAGDALWTDPTHWVTNTDPNYFIIGPNGQLVNGVPNNPGTGKAPDLTVQFGEICFQNSSSSECYNTQTRQERIDNKPIGTGELGLAGNNAGSANVTAGVPSNNAGSTDVVAGVTGWIDDVAPEAQADATPQALPPATIANGLPGATNFVPNNVNPVRITGAIGQFYDVTLAAAGTTTLNTAVTIDRLRIIGAPARLNIAAAGSLTSLIDVNQTAGVNQVDGRLITVGDYLLLGGALVGTGRVDAPFLTNVAGAIGPGTTGGIGTLTLAGNLVLSSGSQFIVDLGNGGTSDRLAVIATTFTGQTPTNGRANLGGTLVSMLATGQIVRYNDRFTVLTAQGGLSGSFSSATPLSAILRPEISYTATEVQVRLNAVSYTTVISPDSRAQLAYAQLLDRNRATGALPGLLDVLDLASVATIQSTLESLAPRSETLRSSIGVAAIDNGSRIIRDRLNTLVPGEGGGTLAYYGRRVQTAALAINGLNIGGGDVGSDVIEGQMPAGRLPENMSGFLAAGYLDGDSRGMAGTLAAGRADFDGWYLAGGLERQMGELGRLGFALSYTDLDGTAFGGGQSASGQLLQATVYGRRDFADGVYVDGQAQAGWLNSDTTRTATIGASTITVRSDDRAMTFAGELGVGAMFGEDSIRFGPRAAIRGSRIDFDRVTESGGITALDINRGNFDSLQGRFEFVAAGRGRVRPNLRVGYVHDFWDRPTVIGANFVGGTGGDVLFDLNSQDHDWIETSGGISIDAGNAELSLSADTTLAREDVRNQSYRATVRFRF
jgi:hypothetical protein